MTIECTYMRYTRAHDRMIFLLVDSARSECSPPRPLPELAPSRFQLTLASSSSLQLAFPAVPCTLPLHVALSLSISLCPLSLSLHPFVLTPVFSARIYRTYSAPLAIQALAADATPCAVKLTLPFIKPLVHLDLVHGAVSCVSRKISSIKN